MKSKKISLASLAKDKKELISLIQKVEMVYRLGCIDEITNLKIQLLLKDSLIALKDK